MTTNTTTEVLKENKQTNKQTKVRGTVWELKFVETYECNKQMHNL